MKKIKNPPVPAKLKLQIISGILLVLSMGLIIANSMMMSKYVKQIIAAKQKKAQTDQQVKNRTDLAAFIDSNMAQISVVDSALPSENSIIDVVETIGDLQKSFKIAPSFEFSAVIPVKDDNQSYIPFNMKLHTSLHTSVEFLRNFEKIPYLTSIQSINIKTPQNLGGPVDVIVIGRLYVQDPFK